MGVPASIFGAEHQPCERFSCCDRRSKAVLAIAELHAREFDETAVRQTQPQLISYETAALIAKFLVAGADEKEAGFAAQPPLPEIFFTEQTPTTEADAWSPGCQFALIDRDPSLQDVETLFLAGEWSPLVGLERRHSSRFKKACRVTEQIFVVLASW